MAGRDVTLGGAPARLVGHDGSPFGATASLMTFPDHHLAIAVTSNVSFANGVAPFSLKLAERFARARHAKPFASAAGRSSVPVLRGLTRTRARPRAASGQTD